MPHPVVAPALELSCTFSIALCDSAPGFTHPRWGSTSQDRRSLGRKALGPQTYLSSSPPSLSCLASRLWPPPRYLIPLRMTPRSVPLPTTKALLWPYSLDHNHLEPSPQAPHCSEHCAATPTSSVAVWPQESLRFEDALGSTGPGAVLSSGPRNWDEEHKANPVEGQHTPAGAREPRHGLAHASGATQDKLPLQPGAESAGDTGSAGEAAWRESGRPGLCVFKLQTRKAGGAHIDHRLTAIHACGPLLGSSSWMPAGGPCPQASGSSSLRPAEPALTCRATCAIPQSCLGHPHPPLLFLPQAHGAPPGPSPDGTALVHWLTFYPCTSSAPLSTEPWESRAGDAIAAAPAVWGPSLRGSRERRVE